MMLQKATINYRRSISLSFTLLMYAGLVIARYVQQQVLLWYSSTMATVNTNCLVSPQNFRVRLSSNSPHTWWRCCWKQRSSNTWPNTSNYVRCSHFFFPHPKILDLTFKTCKQFPSHMMKKQTTRQCMSSHHAPDNHGPTTRRVITQAVMKIIRYARV